MDIDKALKEYETYLKANRRLAPKTVGDYVRNAFRFATWSKLTDTTDITAELVSEYVVQRCGGLADRSFNSYLSQVRLWLVWLAETKRLGEDTAPWRTLILRDRARPVRPKAFIREDEAHELAEKAAQWHERDKAFILAMRGTARRKSELCAMTIGDIDREPRPGMSRGVFTFDNTKGRKVRRTLPILPEFDAFLDEWLPLYAQLIGRALQPDDYLVPAVKMAKGVKTIKGVRHPLELVPKKRLPEGSAQAIMTKLSNKGTHGLRRGMLSDLKSARQAAGHADGLRLAKTLADHESERTTELYMDERREVADLAAAFEPTPPPEGTKASVPDESTSADVIDIRAARRFRSAG